MKLTNAHIAAIKAHIDEKLRQRAIFVETSLVRVKNKSGEETLELTSTPFNTVPVILSEMYIVDYRASIKKAEKALKNEDKTKIIKVYVSVGVSCSGSRVNRVKLFEVDAEIHEQNDHCIFFSTETETAFVGDLSH